VQTYEVQVYRVDPLHVQARVRDVSVTLGAKRADTAAGINPVETLLAAMGSCLLTALATVADLSRIPVDHTGMLLQATRQDKPPRVVGVEYRLWVDTPIPYERLERLVHMAERNSTVFQTLTAAFPVTGTVVQGPYVPQ